jgi:hypothetical protein
MKEGNMRHGKQRKEERKKKNDTSLHLLGIELATPPIPAISTPLPHLSSHTSHLPLHTHLYVYAHSSP